jgi:Spy/CpxP family protein refolding chaperone
MRARIVSLLTVGAIVAAVAVTAFAGPGDPPAKERARGSASDARGPAWSGADDWGGCECCGWGSGRGGGGMGRGGGGMGRGGAWMGRGGRGFGGPGAGLLRGDGPLAEQLKLTGTQREKLRGIGDGLERKTIQTRADMEVARLDLAHMLRDDSSSRSRIENQIDTIAKLRADEMKARVMAHLDAREILTADQRKQLDEWRGSRRAGRGGRR